MLLSEFSSPPLNPNSSHVRTSCSWFLVFDRGSSAQRRPAQGMGLAQASSSGVSVNGKREPLGALEVGESGDVKRVKR